MNDARRLRARLLAALATGGLFGCSSSTVSAPQDATTAPTDVVTQPDVSTPDVSTPDAATPDVSQPDVSQPDVTSIDASSTEDASAMPTCSFGGAPTYQCFTDEALDRAVHSPPKGGTFPDGSVPDASVAPNGCFDAPFVRNGCCNPAAGVPFRRDGQCCYWFCTGACCGRAFVVDGVARTADAAPRADWLVASEKTFAYDEITRAALADAWRDDARMEHASIASFARFTLTLLGLGAPPALVADAQRAGLDEVAHARLCFGLASRFGGVDHGPAPLDVRNTRVDATLLDATLAAITEGCVGETLAALTARAQREHATDPAVRDALTTIADDEARHAELAWRFVAWALSTGDDALRSAAARAFETHVGAVVSATQRRPAGVDARAWRAGGRLDAGASREVVRDAMREVIAPCATALLEGISHATVHTPMLPRRSS